jgi:hypothetical protein
MKPILIVPADWARAMLGIASVAAAAPIPFNVVLRDRGVRLIPLTMSFIFFLPRYCRFKRQPVTRLSRTGS